MTNAVRNAARNSLGSRIEGYAQASVALSTTAAQSAALTEGVYEVWCASDFYLKNALDASDVLTTTGLLVKANIIKPIIVREGTKLGAILAASTATMFYHRVG